MSSDQRLQYTRHGVAPQLMRTKTMGMTAAAPQCIIWTEKGQHKQKLAFPNGSDWFCKSCKDLLICCDTATSEYLSRSAEYFSLFSKKTSAETVEFDGCRSCALLCKEDSVSLHLYQISPMWNWKSPYWSLKLSCFHCLTSILPLIYPPRGKSGAFAAYSCRRDYYSWRPSI